MKTTECSDCGTAFQSWARSMVRVCPDCRNGSGSATTQSFQVARAGRGVVLNDTILNRKPSAPAPDLTTAAPRPVRAQA